MTTEAIIFYLPAMWSIDLADAEDGAVLNLTGFGQDPFISGDDGIPGKPTASSLCWQSVNTIQYKRS